MENTTRPDFSSRIAEDRAPHTADSAYNGRTDPAQYPPVSAGLSGHTFPMEAQISTDASKALRVLIAEDNYANQLIARTLLTRAGFHVTTVANGEDAISVGMETPFDIILMDIEMPVRNGIEATQALRAQAGPNQSTLIIALTAFGSPAEKYAYTQSGINHVLTKPLRVNALTDILQRSSLRLHASSHKPNSSKPTSTQSPLPGETSSAKRRDETDSLQTLVDPETLGRLFDAAGFDGLMPVLKAYWRSAYALLADMQDAHQIWNRDRLQKSAHALKGASVNIGLPAIGRIAAILQNALPEDAAERLDELDLIMARSRKALAREITRLKQQASPAG